MSKQKRFGSLEAHSPFCILTSYFCLFSMSDPAAQLQQIYLAGFELKTFDRFPRCVGVVRNHCIALLVPSPDGLQMLGTPGWEIGEVMGVLTEVEGRQVFQAKQEMVEATPERLEKLRRFREELKELLVASQ